MLFFIYGLGEGNSKGPLKSFYLLGIEKRIEQARVGNKKNYFLRNIPHTDTGPKRLSVIFYSGLKGEGNFFSKVPKRGQNPFFQERGHFFFIHIQ